jgi:DNA-directed RNA polymerase subunit RPC12/RpoP
MTNCLCLRCDYNWESRIDPQDIKKCPSCTSRIWFKAKVEPRTETPEETNKREIEEGCNENPPENS